MLDLLRYAVFAAFVGSALIAVGSWAVRTRRISPFSGATRLIRALTDPIVNPMERWVHRRGGNPQNAPWWLLGVVVVGGILLISVTQWLVVQFARASFAANAGPRGILRLVVYYAGQLVLIALIVRVIASWFGAFRFSPWMRPVYFLTDWIITPLRRVIPPLGMIDITPLVAWIALRIVLSWLMRML
ncbi:MAG TPA: YggT family protein [Gemmatimonadales bacterium]|nr:YggT family protein [Gemmatimonadales bacterium]